MSVVESLLLGLGEDAGTCDADDRLSSSRLAVGHGTPACSSVRNLQITPLPGEGDITLGKAGSTVQPSSLASVS